MKTLSTRARIVTGSAALVAVGAGAFGAVAAAAPDSGKPAQPAAAAAKADVKTPDTFQTDHLTIDAASKAAQATLDAAKKANQRVSVAVVDRNGNTIVTLRGDGAGPQSYDAAQKKAFTAVSWNAPTSTLVQRLQQNPTLKDIPGTLFLGGGAPVTAKGGPIAAIGVAGAPSGDQDEQFAQAGVASLNAK
ncbi:GlcG/HbpS family heme-binding protein [Uniformispora flossi]|uniref:GlcG/HbpS family heme-binding protein n=1 Tax=Uniformispora flossi TaxID=3390723 RepID=UPI003C2FE544